MWLSVGISKKIVDKEVSTRVRRVRSEVFKNNKLYPSSFIYYTWENNRAEVNIITTATPTEYYYGSAHSSCICSHLSSIKSASLYWVRIYSFHHLPFHIKLTANSSTFLFLLFTFLSLTIQREESCRTSGNTNFTSLKVIFIKQLRGERS